jgi:hypothetical protein
MRILFLAIALVLTMGWVPVAAQDPSGVSLLTKGSDFQDEEIYDLIQAYQMVRLKKVLGLDDTQTLELMKHIGTYKDDLTRQRIFRAILREQLRHLLETSADEDAILKSLQHQILHEENLVRTLRAMLDKARESLSTPQRARLYLFVDDFEREVRDLAMKAQSMHQHGEGVSPGATASTVSPGEEQLGTEETEALRKLVTHETRKLDIADEEHEDIIELVDAWMMVRMASELELDPQETIRLFKHVGTYKDQLHQMKWQIGAARSQLRGSLETATDDEIERQLEDLLLQEEAVANLVRVFITEARKDVSTVQAARLYLFLGDFENEILSLISRANQVISAQQRP